MKKDAAIEEIRAVRHKISKRFGHDTRALLDHYREMEKNYKQRMIAVPSADDQKNMKNENDKINTQPE